MDSKLLEPGGGEADDVDVISSLPDDVLLRILSFVPTTEDAIRTRALSRLWRHVWLCLPALAFSDIDKTPTDGLDELVDAALAHCHETLTIHIQHPRHKLSANAWLQRAAERVHGKITLRLDDYIPTTNEDPQWHWRGFGKVVLLDLPCGGGVKTAAMSFSSSCHEDKMSTLRLPTAPPPVNSWLTELELDAIRLDRGSLSDFVSSCAQLRRLIINLVWVKDGPDLRISSKVLEDLALDYISGGVERLEVSCPKLRVLGINKHFACFGSEMAVATFYTPCLEEIHWPLCASLPKSRVEFLSSMDTVRLLNVGLFTHLQTYESHLGPWLLRSCTGVRRLDVLLRNITESDADNVNMMEELPKLSSVTHLKVTTEGYWHTFGASIAKLLSRCCQLQCLEVEVNAKYLTKLSTTYTCPTYCPCKRAPKWRKRKLSLDFLKDVKICYHKHRVYWIDDLNILLRCSSKANVKIHAYDPET